MKKSNNSNAEALPKPSPGDLCEPSWQTLMACDIRPQLTANSGVKNLYLQGTLVSILGHPGTAKTFVALDLLAHHVTGRPWRGHRVNKGAALAVLLEGGTGAQNRLWAQIQCGLLTVDAPLRILIGSIDLCHDDVHARKIIQIAKQLVLATGEPVVTILIDTLAMSFAGGDENGKDMNAVVTNLRLICSETGATVLLVHHLGKDPSKGGRGHSSLWGAMDSELVVTGQTGRRTITVKKQRDLEHVEIMPFELEVVPVGVDEDGDPITTCIVKHLDVGDSDDRKYALVPRCVLDAISKWAHFNPEATGLKLDQMRLLLSELGYDGKDTRKALIRQLKDLRVVERQGPLYLLERSVLVALESGKCGESG
jgi:hypothetical protein